MNTKLTHNDTSVWNKMVHASFRKVMAFDFLFFGLGIGVGVGIGVYLAIS